MTNGCAQYFTHADFFGPLFRSISYQSEQSNAGNKYGEYRKRNKYLSGSLIRLVKPVEIVIHKGIYKRLAGHISYPMVFAFDLFNKTRNIFCVETKRYCASFV